MDKRWRPFSFKSPARRQSYRSDLFGADLQDQPPPPLHTGPVPPTEARMHITLNQQPQPVPPGWEDEPLLWLLREPLGLTGTRFGCGMGQCGACTVLIDGVAQRACLQTARALQGRSITTIEGPAGPDAARAPLPQARG